MESIIVKVLLIGISLTIIHGYPYGAPNTSSVCVSMTPGHGYRSHSGSPYAVSWERHPGKGFYVHIYPRTSGMEYRGFLLQARNGNSTEALGRFKYLHPADPKNWGMSSRTTELTQMTSCSGGFSNAVTHASREKKSERMTFLWLPPTTGLTNGRARFYLTVVQTYNSYSKTSSDEVNFHPATTTTSRPRYTTTRTTTTTTTVMPDTCEKCADKDGCYWDGRYTKCFGGCANGFYSSYDGNCMMCSRACARGMCNNTTGVCNSCYPDGYGIHCDETCFDDPSKCCQGGGCVDPVSGASWTSASLSICMATLMMALTAARNLF